MPTKFCRHFFVNMNEILQKKEELQIQQFPHLFENLFSKIATAQLNY